VSTAERAHDAHVGAQLALLEQDIAGMLQVGKRLFGHYTSPIYPLDLLAYGALKRNLSTAKAIAMMIQAWNMLGARSLLRVHIDTAIRFSAAWLVKDPHEFAMEVMKGARIDKLVDMSGKRLTDAHLVSIHALDHPWLPKVYETLSGYVHFSGSHIYDSITAVSESDAKFTVDLSTTDYKYPVSSWVEVLEFARESSALLAKYLHGYIETKALKSAELDQIWKQSARYRGEENAG
jgi:hypothetical protein